MSELCRTATNRIRTKTLGGGLRPWLRLWPGTGRHRERATRCRARSGQQRPLSGWWLPPVRPRSPDARQPDPRRDMPSDPYQRYLPWLFASCLFRSHRPRRPPNDGTPPSGNPTGDGMHREGDKSERIPPQRHREAVHAFTDLPLREQRIADMRIEVCETPTPEGPGLTTSGPFPSWL